VPPDNVGVIESGNIGGGTGESQEEMFLRNACDPIRLMVFEKITYRVVRDGFGYEDYTISAHYADFRDKKVVTDIQNSRIQNGTLTINEARGETGKPPVDGGDEAVIITRAGATSIKSFADLADREAAQNKIALDSAQVQL